MMAKCIECSNLDLRSNERWANLGFGKCKKEIAVGVMVSVFCDAECDVFSPQNATSVEKRIKWRDKKFPIKD